MLYEHCQCVDQSFFQSNDNIILICTGSCCGLLYFIYISFRTLTLVFRFHSYTKPSAEKLEGRLGQAKRQSSLSDVSVHIGMGELRRPSPKLSLLDRFVNYSRASINSLRSDKHSLNSMAFSEPAKHSLLVGEANCDEEMVQSHECPTLPQCLEGGQLCGSPRMRIQLPSFHDAAQLERLWSSL